MFKSVFAKYITAFMLIILVSFSMLITIITSIFQEFSRTARVDAVYQSALASADYLTARLENAGEDCLMTCAKEAGTEISMLMSAFSTYDPGIVIFITDSAGQIIYAQNGYDYSSFPQEAFSGKIIAAAASDGWASGSGSDAGFPGLPGYYFVNAVYGSGGGFAGAVISCSADEGFGGLLGSLIKAMIMASLWVMLAALIAIYFISEKVIGPLKAMSRAARSFAASNFDVRVPVAGRDEVAELAVAFNNMAGSLASLENMRRDFLANVSHDLRTPMTTIAGFIDGILAGAIPPDKYNYYLNVIADEIRRLSRLVSTLLDISRLTAGDRKLDIKPFDICETARRILISFEKKIEEHKLQVEFICDDDNIIVNADPDAIYQVLYNLCDNAVKFSHTGGVYRIAIRRAERDRKVGVSVYNEGQGIGEEDLPFVFERFYKIDKSRGLDKTGVGLGLYISKTIITSHGENIWVDSEAGKFCEFGFTLPQKYNKSN